MMMIKEPKGYLTFTLTKRCRNILRIIGVTVSVIMSILGISFILWAKSKSKNDNYDIALILFSVYCGWSIIQQFKMLE